MELNFNRALFLGAHPDDEFGCSATLAKFLERGKDVYYCYFSQCEQSVSEGLPKDILVKENSEAMKILGLSEQNCFHYNFPVRYLPEHRQDILETMIKIKYKYCPDLVFVPSLTDIHQDHNTIAQEAIRAFKHSTILGYELPMNTISFENACFISIDEKHLAKKIDSLLCYKSQGFRKYANEEFLRSLAKVRGVQIETEYAESFQVIRLVYKD